MRTKGDYRGREKFLQGTAEIEEKEATPPFCVVEALGGQIWRLRTHLRRQELDRSPGMAGANSENSGWFGEGVRRPKEVQKHPRIHTLAGGARTRAARRFCRERRSTMALQRDRDGKRLHVKSKLMGESLVSKRFVESLPLAPQVRLFPDVHVLKVGGQSICDRGVKALPGIIREITANKAEHKMLLTTGGGTRSRHIYAIGLELGMPTSPPPEPTDRTATWDFAKFTPR
jgi:hypothetical protein